MSVQPDFFMHDPEVKPCFRIPFRMILSDNDLVGEKWERTQRIELWRERGMKRFCEAAKEAGHEIESFAEQHEYTYRGKKKVKLRAGNRLKESLFDEPIIMIVRLWLCDDRRFDINNIHLKALTDGFVDARMIPDDEKKWIRGVFRWFEGIDPSCALSEHEKAERARQTKNWKAMGMKRNLPPPADKRIYLDLYKISRIVHEKINMFDLIGFPEM